MPQGCRQFLSRGLSECYFHRKQLKEKSGVGYLLPPSPQDALHLEI